VILVDVRDVDGVELLAGLVERAEARAQVLAHALGHSTVAEHAAAAGSRKQQTVALGRLEDLELHG
jgi:hypothetical protein